MMKFKDIVLREVTDWLFIDCIQVKMSTPFCNEQIQLVS